MLLTRKITLHEPKIIRDDHKVLGAGGERILFRKKASSKLAPLKYMTSNKVQEGKK